jgi:hypothetical protein
VILTEQIDVLIFSWQSWMIDNVVVPLASGYGLANEYKYLKSSKSQYLTGLHICPLTKVVYQNKISCHYDGGAAHRCDIPPLSRDGQS